MKPGDQVTFTVTTQKGHGFHLSSKEGTIEQINGNAATVKYKNGRKTTVALSRLRLKGELSELTEAVMSAGKN